MFGFSNDSYEEYKKEVAKNFQFPLETFEFRIIGINPSVQSKFDSTIKQAEITFSINMNGAQIERKDWFGYTPKDMWKWSDLLKSCEKSNIDIKNLKPSDLMNVTGFIRGYDSKSKTKTDEYGNPLITRKVKYVTKRSETSAQVEPQSYTENELSVGDDSIPF